MVLARRAAFALWAVAAVYAAEFSIQSSHAGVTLRVNGEARTIPASLSLPVDVPAGSRLTVDIDNPQLTGDGTRLVLEGKAKQSFSETFTVPAAGGKVAYEFTPEYLLTVNIPSATSASSGNAARVWTGPSVPLTATCATGRPFTNFVIQGSGSPVTVTQNPHTLAMNEPKTVTINCGAAATSNVNVTVLSSPPRLTVRIDAVEGVTPFTRAVSSGADHTLTAPSPVSLNGDSRYVFDRWTPGNNLTANPLTVRPTADVTYTANYTGSAFKLTTATVGGCGLSVQPPPAPDGFYDAGTEVTLTATPPTGSVFTGFSGGLTATTSPARVTMDSAKTVTATCTAATQVTVTAAPSNLGLRVTVDGSTVDTPFSTTWAPGSRHTLVAASTQVIGSTEYGFTTWSPVGSEASSIAVNAPTSATTYTANYRVNGHRVTVNVNPAASCTFTLSPSASSSGFFSPGSRVTITARPNQGYFFQSYSGSVSGQANPQTFIVDGPESITINCPRIIIGSRPQ